MLILHLEGQPFSILGFTIPESKHSVLCEDRKVKDGTAILHVCDHKGTTGMETKDSAATPLLFGAG